MANKFGKLVADTLKGLDTEVSALAQKAVEVAVAPKTEIPNEPIVVSKSLADGGIVAERIAEVAYVAKSMRRELGFDGLTKADTNNLSARFKAVGVTTDVVELLPSGFTGALWHDIQERLVVASVIPFKEISAPGKYDTIAVHGIQGYLTGENVTATESSEDYITMMYLVAKCMAAVKKSYEVLDDSLIDLASEVRTGIVRALAEAIEQVVISGDNSVSHMDDGVDPASYKNAYKGLRKLGLGKATIDFGGASMTDDELYTYILQMQEAGGVYTDDLCNARGELCLIVDQNFMNRIKKAEGFLTKDKAGMGTLFGMNVPSIFGIPVLQTPYLPKVDATGVVSATPGDNTLGTCVLFNKTTMIRYATGTPLMESDRDILTQFLSFTGSIRTGYSSVFDRLDTDTNAIDSNRANIIVGINVFRG